MVKPMLGIVGGVLFKANYQGVPIITQPCKKRKIKEHNTGMTETSMNTELWLIHSIAGSNKHGKSAKDNRFTDLVKITGHGRKQHQVAMFRA